MNVAIHSCADTDTETVWRDKRVRRFQAIQAQATCCLNVLNAVTSLDDLRHNPGARRHRLTGARASPWAIALNEQYGPTNGAITDYHR